MYLLYGALCLSVATLMFTIALLGSRNPVRPFWAAEEVITYALTLIIGIFSMGVVNIIKALLIYSPPSISDAGYAAATLAIAFAIFKMLKVRTHLTAFETETNSGKIIPLDFEVGNQNKQTDSTLSGYAKAA